MPIASKPGAPRTEGKGADWRDHGGNLHASKGNNHVNREHNTHTDPYAEVRRPERSFAFKRPKQFI